MWARGLIAGLARLARDWQWWLAFAAGPLFWWLLAAWGTNLGDVRWPLAQPLLFLRLALLTPILEEIVFRGALQSGLLARTWGKRRIAGISAANAVTSVIFSALHFFAHPPLWAASVFVPSLVFGYFRERHASLLPAMLLHVAYNTGYFWLFFAPGAH